MMQAIVTRYVSPTNFKGTRVKATASAGSILIGYDYSLDIDGNHRKAAEALANKYGWLETTACAVCGVGAVAHKAKAAGALGGSDHWWKAAEIGLEGGVMANGDYCWIMVK